MAKFTIRGDSLYFKQKYGTANPIIDIEGNWREITGRSWGESTGNPAALLFAMRAGVADIPTDDAGVLYGKIGPLGEIVHQSELDPLEPA